MDTKINKILACSECLTTQSCFLFTIALAHISALLKVLYLSVCFEIVYFAKLCMFTVDSLYISLYAKNKICICIVPISCLNAENRLSNVFLSIAKS